MSDKLSTESYKGVRDFYPEEYAKLLAMFALIREELALWGYQEYNASPLERAELYEAKTSEEIVNEQTYTFTDRGDRRVTLRPEMTPTLARMVAAKRRELAYPLRWFSIGNRFRYERPQRGRLREFYQSDVDLIGLGEGEADIEIIRIASAILKRFGATDTDFVIRMNSRTLLGAACEAAGLKEESTRQYLRLLDKKAKMAPEEFEIASQTISTEDPLRIIESADEASPVGIEKKKLLERISKLKELGVSNVVFDVSITRGFDYYTGMVFEVFDTNPENPRAMFGGGRYDGLMALFGEELIPAVGFAIGEVTLADFIATHGLTSLNTQTAPDLFIGTPTTSDVDAANSLADTLRKAGVRTVVNLSDRGLGDQVKDAVKRGIPYFLAYGADEVSSGSVRLKTLATSEEAAVPVTELASRVMQH